MTCSCEVAGPRGYFVSYLLPPGVRGPTMERTLLRGGLPTIVSIQSPPAAAQCAGGLAAQCGSGRSASMEEEVRVLFAAAELGRADIIGKAIESLTTGTGERHFSTTMKPSKHFRIYFEV